MHSTSQLLAFYVSLILIHMSNIWMYPVSRACLVGLLAGWLTSHQFVLCSKNNVRHYAQTFQPNSFHRLAKQFRLKQVNKLQTSKQNQYQLKNMNPSWIKYWWYWTEQTPSTKILNYWYLTSSQLAWLSQDATASDCDAGCGVGFVFIAVYNSNCTI